MAFDEGLAQRLREHLRDIPGVEEKSMFGGLAFMVRGNMCVGVVHSTLMARVGADQYETLLSHPHARPMDFTGKPLRGFIYVDEEGIEEDDDLQAWIDRACGFVQTLPAK